ncbi:MAG: CaiB/BaiF CoA transferase family protein [Alphaproteobacteria bacterium]
MTDEGWPALDDVRVFDLTGLLPGPFATQILADLGADVVKVESIAGDGARRLPMEMFRMANRNKRSIALDLKHPGAKPVVRRLAEWADVAIEGFRPGVADRLGVSYEALSAINPRIVYCSISGYGQSGPWRDVPGHDLNYLAAGGAMSLPGHWLERTPKRSGLPVADVTASCFAAIAILSALRKRERTGKGCRLDISLTDAALAFTALRRGLDVDEPGRLYLFPINDLFETRDGRAIALGMVEEHFWRNFRKAVAGEMPALDDPRFDDEASRREHGDELSRLMHELIRRRTAAEWLALLASHDVPVQLAMTPREAAESDQMRARGVVRSIDGERHIPFPVLVDGAPGGAARSAAPTVGAHTLEVLTGLGIAEAEVRAMIAAGAAA